MINLNFSIATFTFYLSVFFDYLRTCTYQKAHDIHTLFDFFDRPLSFLAKLFLFISSKSTPLIYQRSNPLPTPHKNQNHFRRDQDQTPIKNRNKEKRSKSHSLSKSLPTSTPTPTLQPFNKLYD